MLSQNESTRASANSSSQTAECPKLTNKNGNKTELSETAFRLAEKKYKLFRLDARASKRQAVEVSDFSDVIDFHSFNSNTSLNQSMMRLVSEKNVVRGADTDGHDNTSDVDDEQLSSQTAKKHRAESPITSPSSATSRTQRCYTFDGVPGLLFFPSALTEPEQRYWCSQALDRYAQSPPFPNNITTLDDTIVTTRYGGPHLKRVNDEVKKEEAQTDSDEANKANNGTNNEEGNKLVPLPNAAKEKMRWATLGFKYNWTTKSYDRSKYCLFPADLSRMIKDTFFTMLAPVAASSLKIKGTDGEKADAEAVALATAKALELAKGLQMPCKFSSAVAAVATASPCGGVPTNCSANTKAGDNHKSIDLAFSEGVIPVTSNPNNLPAAAPITLLANAVAASHKDISNEEILSALLSPSYEPQTAIVNYFPIGSMMCAHQDLSEPCLHRPLISVSLGASCIFLMGSTSREDPPHAFLLRSGDIVAFTGPSRVAFHAVPRVLEDCPQHLIDFDGRMKDLRININVRQVYDETQPQLADPIF